MDMNLLRASVAHDSHGWCLTLLDLEVVVEGDTEQEMLLQLEHALVAEYVLAKKFGQVPFAKLAKLCCDAREEKWSSESKTLKSLNLPAEVRSALAHAMGKPDMQEFRVQQVDSAA
jgi:hypothetical protein